jgi:hypothetical protein
VNEEVHLGKVSRFKIRDENLRRPLALRKLKKTGSASPWKYLSIDSWSSAKTRG